MRYEDATGYWLKLPGGDETLITTAGALDEWLQRRERERRQPEPKPAQLALMLDAA